MSKHPPLRITPHIRLNSGRHEPIEDDDDSPPAPPPHGMPRAVTSPSGALTSPSSALTSPSDLPSPGIRSLRSAGSSDFLIPPKPYWAREGATSPDGSMLSSRRTSFDSSWAGSTSRLGYYPVSAYPDSYPASRGSSQEDLNTQTVGIKYNILPTDGLLLFPEDVEKDDYLHNPNPEDKERHCDVCNRRGIVNMTGLILLTLGFSMLFIGYPVMTFVRQVLQPKPPVCGGDPLCLDVGTRPLLKNLRTGLIDPDTPESAKWRTSADGREWKLVFSDEFSTDGRTFYDGDDPYYQAMDLWYGATDDLEYYDPDAVTTRNGVLELRFEQSRNHDLNYRSGMVQSWNKLCFTGGRLEASASMPGRGDVSGFWPGFWTMGNLGRPGYAATTDGMWPYSYYDECDVGITPNQSSTDGISFLPGMRLPACTCKGSSHPSPGKSRSAPEVDVFEANVSPLNGNLDALIGTVSQSMQVAPFDVWYMPDYDFAAVYDDQVTDINPYRGGRFQQAMSGLTNLNNDWYDGNEYQIYAFEYSPGATGNITWFVGEDTKTWTLDGRAIGPNGNVGQRVIPMEPMSIVMNLGMATSFAFINKTITDYMPGILRFDYIRIYQDPDQESVTCDPEGYETTEYIEKHAVAYQNPNKTSWADAGYGWPKNSFMDRC